MAPSAIRLRTGERIPVAGKAVIGACILFTSLLLGGTAQAEKADRDKPVNIESDRMTADDARKTATFEGRVVLTQGTMAIRADRIIVRQDNDGFQTGSATGGAGGLATFRQKRDGVNEYIEAEAERIEYDGKADRVEFFNRARLRRGDGDDVCGNYISYDSRTEFFTVNAGKSPAASAGGRVRAIIMPRNAGAPAQAKPPASPAAPCPG
jgi:lipopolysaccharide export system protein LptA